MEPSCRYGTSRMGSKSGSRDNQSQKDGHIYQKPKHQDDKSTGNTDSLKRRQEMERLRLLKSGTHSADRLSMSDRSFYRQLYSQERSSRRSSFSKSSKSLNRNYEFCDKPDSRIYEEIKHKSSDCFPKFESSSGINDGIYTKINAKKTRSNEGFISDGKGGKKEIISNPTTPKYKRKMEKRSSSLPRRKVSSTSIQKSDGVTHTDFPYDEKLLKHEEAPITPNVTNRRSSSYENVNFEEDFMKKLSTKCGKSDEKEGKEEEKDKKNEEGEGKFKSLTPIYHFEDMSHDMTSLTSSGYDTQTNSIVSTTDHVPYSLKLNKNFITSSTPPPSLTITEDFEENKNNLNKGSSENSSRSVSPYSPPTKPRPDNKPLLNVSSNISVTTGIGNKNSLSVQVTTNPRNEPPKVYVSSNSEGGKTLKTTKITDTAEIYVESPVNSVVTLQNHKNERKSKLERFPSLYSPREVLKSGYGFDDVESRPGNNNHNNNNEDEDNYDLDVERRKFSDLGIETISKNQENCSMDKFIIDSERDDYGLSHKPIPRHFNQDFGRMFDECDERGIGTGNGNKTEGKKSGSKIPVMKNRKNLERPSSVESTQSLSKRDICNKDFHEFPSLSDLSVNFKSIAAQNILNNISVTSVDTLVEVNMAANNLNEKSNPLVNVHTDLGIL